MNILQLIRGRGLGFGQVSGGCYELRSYEHYSTCPLCAQVRLSAGRISRRRIVRQRDTALQNDVLAGDTSCQSPHPCQHLLLFVFHVNFLGGCMALSGCCSDQWS